MSLNLLDLVKDQVTGQLAKNASSFLGESESGVTSALGSIFPSLLGSVVDKVGQGESGANSIMKMIGGLDDGLLDNIGGLFSGGASSVNGLLNSGGGIVDSLFGNKIGGVIDLISNASGLKSGSTSSLMKMAAPFLMSLIGKKVAGGGISALTDLIMGQKSHVANAMPSGLGGVLGFASNLFDSGKDAAGAAFDAGKKVVDGAADVAGKAAGTAYDTGKKVVGGAVDVAGDVAEGAVKTGSSLLKWLLPLLLVLLALGFLARKGCKTGVDVVDNAAEKTLSTTENVVDGAANVAKDASEAVGDAAAGAVNWTSDALKSVFSVVDEAAKATLDKISFVAGSAGDQMVKFIDGGFDGDPVFRFNNLNFDTGSATIKDPAEINNIGAIMKAYPNLKIEVRGHTDNTGDAEANKTLSDARANSVRARLIAEGVNASRIATKGYGQEMPVASNDTEEGRAQNRRIEVVIVK